MWRYLTAAVAVVAACLLAASVRAGDPAPGSPSGAEVFARLKSGNERFVAGAATHPHEDAARRAATAHDGQKPIATVVACSDSREPVEIVLDQGIGDLFVVRVAGNVCDTDEIGSVEYGVGHLGTPAVLVLGHTGCGAVTAAVMGDEVHASVAALIDKIRPSVASAQAAHADLHGEDLVPAAVEANVWRSIEQLLTRSAELRDHVRAGSVRIEGAIYDLETGKVRWLGPHPEEKRLLAGAGK